MELGAQFVRHRVTHAEEGVSERDTGDSRGTVNALTGNRVLGTFVIGSRQVLFQQFQRLQRLAVRELRSQYGNVSFQGDVYKRQVWRWWKRCVTAANSYRS